jgi:hypothetical protein
VFGPITLLCTFNIELLRWALIIYAVTSSGYFLFINLQRFLTAAQGNMKYIIIGVTLLGHVALGFYYRLYFFKSIGDE